MVSGGWWYPQVRVIERDSKWSATRTISDGKREQLCIVSDSWPVDRLGVMCHIGQSLAKSKSLHRQLSCCGSSDLDLSLFHLAS